MLVMRELNHEEQDSLEAYLHNYDFEKTKIDLNKKLVLVIMMKTH